MYAEIIDKGECMSTLNQYHDFPWPEPFLKKIACRDEWSKYNFYPSNGLVGKIAYNMESTIYILIINELFYVPMSKKGIQFISEKEYSERISTQLITGMDERQKKINNNWDQFTNSNQIIDAINLNLLRSLSLHSTNRQWISQNTPKDLINNLFNSDRSEAPFSCISSIELILKQYSNEPQYREMINQMIGYLEEDLEFKSWNFNQIIDWIVNQTLRSAIHHKLDKLDANIIVWWMGFYTYAVCIVNTHYKYEYESIFISAWGKYFTNETLLYDIY